MDRGHSWSLDIVTQSMTAVAANLTTAEGQLSQGGTDVRMRKVPEQCKVHIKLSKGRAAVVEAARARFHMTLNKSNLERFQAKLDECVKSLNSLLVTKTL